MRPPAMRARRRVGLYTLVVAWAMLVGMISAADVPVACPSSPCSFSAVVSALAGAASESRLVLASGTYTGCASAAAFPSDRNITVYAPNGATIDCGLSGRAFSASGSTTPTTITIDGLTVTRAQPPPGSVDQPGAAMAIYGTLGLRFVIRNSRFIGNTAFYKHSLNSQTITGYGFGGVLHAVGEMAIDISNAEFAHNAAGWGGALSISRPLSVALTNVIATNNTLRTYPVIVPIDYACSYCCLGGVGGFLYLLHSYCTSGDYDCPRLTVTNLTATQNFANGGGAVIAIQGFAGYLTATFRDSNMTRNRSPSATTSVISSGTGVCISSPQSSATFERTAIEYNEGNVLPPVHLGQDGFGGGVALIDIVSATFTNSSVSNNLHTRGGGIYFGGSSLVMSRTRVAGNNATNYGGGLLTGTLTANSCVFDGNVATNNGGGLYYASATSPQWTSIIFSRNSAGGYGGGLWVPSNLALTLTGATFDRNVACAQGGAHYGGYQWAMIDSQVTGNSATIGGVTALSKVSGAYTAVNTVYSGNYATNGGAFQFYQQPLANFTGCRFENHRVPQTGGVFDASSSTLRFTNCVFIGNSATAGGDMSLQASSARLDVCTSDSAQGDRGAVVFMGTASTLTITGGSISRSLANNGAIHVDVGTAQLTNVSFSGCTSSDNGGAVLLKDRMTIVGGGFRGCSASLGGALGLQDSGSVVVIGTMFTGNTAGFNGGAINGLAFSQLNASGCTFDANSAAEDGGAIALDNASNGTIAFTTLQNNRATTGAGLYVAAGAAMISDSLFTANTASGSGGGIAAVGTLLLARTSVTNNNALEGGGLALTSNVAASIVSSHLDSNTATRGAGLACETCTASIFTATILSNRATSLGAGMFCPDGMNFDTMTIDAATSVDLNAAADEPAAEMHCQSCGCCSFTAPAHLSTDAPCALLPGRTCPYACDAGYSVVQPGGALCPTPRAILAGNTLCQAIKCEPLAAVFGVNFTAAVTPSYTGDIAFLSCLPGTIASSNQTLTLTCVGPDWVGGSVSCTARPCPSLTRIDHGSIVITRVRPDGDTAEYTCESGYTLSGPAVRQCTYPDWDGTDPVCQPGTCDAAASSPLSPLTLDRLSAGTTGTLRTYGCIPGYQLVGGADGVQRCVGLEWVVNSTDAAPVPLACERASCEALGADPANCVVTISSIDFGGTATYTCNEGYALVSGSPVLQCGVLVNQTKPLWIGTVPSCEAVTCPALAAVYASTCAAPYGYQAACDIGCAAGYAGLTITDYRCTQAAVNGFGNWTVGAANTAAYFTSCVECPVGTYSDPLNNARQCSTCTGGTTRQAASAGAASCQCLPGFYEADPVNTPGVCSVCLTGGSCPGGKLPPVADVGYYQAGTHLIPCAPTAICTGNNTCLPGHMGYLCATCVEGWYKVQGYCHQCPDQSIAIVVVGIIVGLLFAVILIVVSRPGPRREHVYGFGSLTLALSWAQVIATYHSFQIPWPKTTKNVFDTFSISNINIELFTPECAFSLGYLDRIQFILAIPLVVAGFTMVVGFVWAVVSFVRDRAGFQQHKRSIGSNLVAGYLNFVTLLYLVFAKASLEPLQCTKQLDGDVTVSLAPGVHCYTPEWESTVRFCIFGIVVYVIGIPAALLFMYWFFKPGADGVLDPLFAFYVAKFTDKAWYYEMIILARKLIFVLFAVFIHDQTVLQAACTVTLLFVSCLITIRLAPYRYRKQSYLEVVLLASQVIILFGGLLMTFTAFQASATADAIVVFVVVVAAVGVALVFGAEVHAFFRARRLAKELDILPVSLSSFGAFPLLALVGDVAVGVDSESGDLRAAHVIHEEKANAKRALREVPVATVGGGDLGAIRHVAASSGSREECLVTVDEKGVLSVWNVGHEQEDELSLRPIGSLQTDVANVVSLHCVDEVAVIVSAAGEAVLVSLGASAGSVDSRSNHSDTLSQSRSKSFSKSISASSASGQSASKSASASRVSASGVVSYSEQEESSRSSLSRSSKSVSHSSKSSDDDDESSSHLTVLARFSGVGEDLSTACIALSARHMRIASGAEVKQWNISVQDGGKVAKEPMSTWRLPDAWHVSAVAGWGAQTLIGDRSGVIRVLDERMGHSVMEIHAHARAVTQLTVHGHWVFSAGADGVVKLWDATTWEHLQTLARAASPISSLAFNSASRTMAIGCSDRTLIMARVEPAWHIGHSRVDCYDAYWRRRMRKRSQAGKSTDDSLDGETSLDDLMEKHMHRSAAQVADRDSLNIGRVTAILAHASATHVATKTVI